MVHRHGEFPGIFDARQGSGGIAGCPATDGRTAAICPGSSCSRAAPGSMPLQGSPLRQADLRGTNTGEASLSGSALEGFAAGRDRFIGIGFDRCPLRGASLRDAHRRKAGSCAAGPGAADLRRARFERRDRRGVDSRGCRTLGLPARRRCRRRARTQRPRQAYSAVAASCTLFIAARYGPGP